MCKFRFNEKGVATIEFAMLFLPFFFFVATIIESLIFMYKVAVIDYLTDDIAKHNITYEGNFQVSFTDEMKQRAAELFIDLNEENTLTKVEFCENLAELRDDKCSATEEKFAIAKYKVIYDIKPIFLSLRPLLTQEEFIESVAVFPTERDIPKGE